MDKLLLTVEEAAALLNISRTRMYGLVTAGHVFSIKLGRVRRVPATALTQFLQRLEETGWLGEEEMKVASTNAAMGAGRPAPQLQRESVNLSMVKPVRK